MRFSRPGLYAGGSCCICRESEFAAWVVKRVPTRRRGATLSAEAEAVVEVEVDVRRELSVVAGFFAAREGRVVEERARLEVASARALRFSGTRERVGREAAEAGIEDGIEVVFSEVEESVCWRDERVM